jgi:hypothetical protein
MTIRIFLALQEFADGRVMFRRYSPDVEGHLPGGTFQRQTIQAFGWLHYAGMPLWVDGKVIGHTGTTPQVNRDPFEVCNAT